MAIPGRRTAGPARPGSARPDPPGDGLSLHLKRPAALSSHDPILPFAGRRSAEPEEAGRLVHRLACRVRSAGQADRIKQIAVPACGRIPPPARFSAREVDIQGSPRPAGRIAGRPVLPAPPAAVQILRFLRPTRPPPAFRATLKEPHRAVRVATPAHRLRYPMRASQSGNRRKIPNGFTAPHPMWTNAGPPRNGAEPRPVIPKTRGPAPDGAGRVPGGIGAVPPPGLSRPR